MQYDKTYLDPMDGIYSFYNPYYKTCCLGQYMVSELKLIIYHDNQKVSYRNSKFEVTRVSDINEKPTYTIKEKHSEQWLYIPLYEQNIIPSLIEKSYFHFRILNDKVVAIMDANTDKCIRIGSQASSDVTVRDLDVESYNTFGFSLKRMFLQPLLSDGIYYISGYGDWVLQYSQTLNSLIYAEKTTENDLSQQFEIRHLNNNHYSIRSCSSLFFLSYALNVQSIRGFLTPYDNSFAWTFTTNNATHLLNIKAYTDSAITVEIAEDIFIRVSPQDPSAYQDWYLTKV